MLVKAVAEYSAQTRSLALAMKDVTNDVALDLAASQMAPLVPRGAVLVPAPSSTGKSRATEELCRRIAHVVPGTEVRVLVERVEPVPSSLLLRRAGLPPVTLERHVETMGLTAEGRDFLRHGSVRPVVLIDNVITSGNTVRAVEERLGLPVTVVVYADARGYVRKNPASGRRPLVVVAGPRNCDAESLSALLAVTDSLLPILERVDVRDGPFGDRRPDYIYVAWNGWDRDGARVVRRARELGVPCEVMLTV